MRQRWMAYMGVIAAIIGFTQAASASEQIPRVLVTLAPLQSYVDSILHGVARTENLARDGQDPHTFSLTPSQARALDTADILIVPQAKMNAGLARTVAGKKNLRVIDLSLLPGANPLPYARENPWLSAVKKHEEDDAGHEHHEHDAHEHHDAAKKSSPFANEKSKPHDHEHEHNHDHEDVTALDPHLWLDPERMAAIAVPLADAIAEFSPGNRSTLRRNATELARHLRAEVMPGMAALLVVPAANPHPSSKPEIPFITYHAAYQYFMQRFTLERTGEITARPEDYLGAKTLTTLLATAKSVHIRCIIGESESTLVRRIAKASDAKIMLLSPEQNVDKRDVPPLDWVQSDYDRLLYKTAKTFGSCL